MVEDNQQRNSRWMLNGQLGVFVHPQDRAFSYGDGIFTTIAWRNDTLEFLPAHIQRLIDDAQRLAIEFSPLDLKKELDVFIAHLQQCNIVQGVIKIIISRGQMQRGYRIDNAVSATRCISYQDIPMHIQDWVAQGITMRVCNLRLAKNVVPGAKHLNRLEQVLARAEWQDSNIQEGVLLNEQAQVVEATAANIFWFKGSILYTPILDQQGVKGVLREQILTVAQQHNIKCEHAHYVLADIMRADELFICNSLLRVCPVTKLHYVENASHKIKNWRIGERTLNLKTLIENAIT